MAEEQLTPTSARRARGRNSYLFKVDNELTVRIRKLDMTTMVLEQLIPFDLLRAANKFESMVNEVAKIGQQISQSDEVADKALLELEKLNPAELKTMVDFLRHYAVVVVMDPILVLKDDDNLDHLPVTEISGDQLMAIFYARPPREEGAPVAITAEQAEEFRRSEPAVPSPDVPVGESVQREAELVDYTDREGISI